MDKGKYGEINTTGISKIYNFVVQFIYKNFGLQ